MTKKKQKLKEIVLERDGVIREGSQVLHSDVWILHDRYVREGHDVALAAIRLGYEVGDRIKYRIVIKPKR